MKKLDLEKKREFVADIRRALIAYRDARGLTQQGVADLLGVHRSRIGNFETGNSMLREDVLNSVVSLLRSPAALFADELRNLADFLDSPEISDRIKLERFFHRITELYMTKESFGTGKDEGSHAGE